MCITLKSHYISSTLLFGINYVPNILSKYIILSKSHTVRLHYPTSPYYYKTNQTQQINLIIRKIFSLILFMFVFYGFKYTFLDSNSLLNFGGGRVVDRKIILLLLTVHLLPNQICIPLLKKIKGRLNKLPF